MVQFQAQDLRGIVYFYLSPRTAVDPQGKELGLSVNIHGADPSPDHSLKQDP